MIILSGAGEIVSFSSPADEPTLDWWLKADSLALSDGDSVVDWLDSSGANKHYGQDTVGVQPIKQTAGGFAVVRFTNDRLVPDPNPRTLSAANTMIVVCTKSSTTNSYIFAGNGGGATPAFISRFSSKDFEYFYAGGSERQTFIASTDTALHILTLTRADNVGNYIGYLDGVQIFSVAVDPSNDWGSGGEIQEIGANGIAIGDDFYNGDIAEIIHCSSVLGSTQLTNMHRYLGTKYGITVP